MVGLFGFQVRNARFASYFRITEDKLTQSRGVNINWGNSRIYFQGLTYLKRGICAERCLKNSRVKTLRELLMLTFVGTFVVGGAILEESYLNQGGVGVTGGLVEGNLSQSCGKDKTASSSLLFPNVHVKQIFFMKKSKKMLIIEIWSPLPLSSNRSAQCSVQGFSQCIGKWPLEAALPKLHPAKTYYTVGG